METFVPCLFSVMIGCFVGTVVGEVISDWLGYPKETGVYSVRETGDNNSRWILKREG